MLDGNISVALFNFIVHDPYQSPNLKINILNRWFSKWKTRWTYQRDHGMDERDVLVLQRFHVAHQARLRMVSVEDRLCQISAGPLPFWPFYAGRQQIGLLGNLFGCFVHFENGKNVVDIFLAYRLVQRDANLKNISITIKIANFNQINSITSPSGKYLKLISCASARALISSTGNEGLTRMVSKYCTLRMPWPPVSNPWRNKKNISSCNST